MDQERPVVKVKNVLVVSGHPRLDGDSVANAAIVGELAKLDGYSIDRLDALYPDFVIDVSYASRVDEAAREAIAEKGREQAARVAKLIEEL